MIIRGVFFIEAPSPRAMKGSGMCTGTGAPEREAQGGEKEPPSTNTPSVREAANALATRPT